MKYYLPIVWMLCLFSAKAQPFLAPPFQPTSLFSIPYEVSTESFSPESPTTFNINGDNLVARYIDYWNSAEMAWAISDSVSYEYNTDGELLNIKTRRLIDGAWVFQNRIDYSYNEDGLLDGSITSSWLGMNWGYTNLDIKLTYSYNGNMQLTSIVQQNWKEGIWQNFFRNTLEYDGESQMLSVAASANWVDAGWQNSNRTRYLEYDEMENVLLEERDYWSIDNEWVPQARFNRAYTSFNSIALVNVESYWVEDDEWRPSIRRTYTYDANDFLVGWLQEFWSSESSEPGWENYFRNTYQNTTDGLIINVQNQNWNTDLGGWVNSFQESYEYNEYSQEYYRLYERWNSSAEIWENNQQVFSYYGEGLTSTDEVINTETSSLCLFPNPSTGQINVNFSERYLVDDQVLVNVYTIDGQLAKEMGRHIVNMGTISLDLRNLLPGSYVIHIIAGPQNWARYVELKK